jgi:AcrR family transcriptional regulator
MKKGAQTKQRIVSEAAQLFNQKGYFGTAIDEVLEATGLRKGGLYRHFPNKENLALEAFHHCVEQYAGRYQKAMTTAPTVVGQLKAMVRESLAIAADPPFPGGCPVLNTSVESDDALPFLREAVLQVHQQWFGLIGQAVLAGQASGELPSSLDPQKVAHLLVGGLEGGLYQAQLFKDVSYLQLAVHNLETVIDSLPQGYAPCTKLP